MSRPHRRSGLLPWSRRRRRSHHLLLRYLTPVAYVWPDEFKQHLCHLRPGDDRQVPAVRRRLPEKRDRYSTVCLALYWSGGARQRRPHRRGCGRCSHREECQRLSRGDEFARAVEYRRSNGNSHRSVATMCRRIDYDLITRCQCFTCGSRAARRNSSSHQRRLVPVSRNRRDDRVHTPYS